MIVENKVFLGRDAILALDDLSKEELFVPEWNTWVFVRALTGAERDAFEQSMVDQQSMAAAKKGKSVKPKMDMKNIRARLVVLTAVDEDGKRLFSDGDTEALGRKSALALNRIFEVAQRLSGIRAEDIDEIEKN